ncbi:MAG: fibronectin type III domain-containing protein, partial [Kiritimatiellae bacterium]|nr:fibronectin type III domain-containing protein [Kiritimatiellia bacterium]
GGSIILDETTSDLSYDVTGLDPDTTYYARVRMAGGEWSEVQDITTTTGGGEPVEVNIESVTIDSANGTLSFEVPAGATVMTTSNLVNGAWIEYEGDWPIPLTGGPAFFRIGNPPEGN